MKKSLKHWLSGQDSEPSVGLVFLLLSLCCCFLLEETQSTVSCEKVQSTTGFSAAVISKAHKHVTTYYGSEFFIWKWAAWHSWASRPSPDLRHGHFLLCKIPLWVGDSLHGVSYLLSLFSCLAIRSACLRVTLTDPPILNPKPVATNNWGINSNSGGEFLVPLWNEHFPDVKV